MFRNLEQEIDAAANVEKLAFGLLGAALGNSRWR
jgi:hypothetical protein